MTVLPKFQVVNPLLPSLPRGFAPKVRKSLSLSEVKGRGFGSVFQQPVSLPVPLYAGPRIG